MYSHLGVSPPCGFLLHGPPGCGKTLVAHAIAGELDLPFFKLAATEVVTGISGESEEKIRKLFQKAKVSVYICVCVWGGGGHVGSFSCDKYKYKYK